MANKRTMLQVKRCAIYTRKSSDEGLEQAFNSLDAQREACESYIQSQRHEGWSILPTQYDDGGYSGGSMNRPALQSLLKDIKEKNIDVIVVYKVDRLSRSLADFVRLIELFDKHNISFVSVTQQFNTSTSMGRLTLNVLLSFAQFEREVTSERIRDKIAASKQKGMWMGGTVPIGYDVQDKLLVVNEPEAEIVRHIFKRYLELGCVRKLKTELDEKGYTSKPRESAGKVVGQKSFSRGVLYALLKNPLYIGKTRHQGKLYDGQHAAIVDTAVWEATQALLTRNRHHSTIRTPAKDPGLLAGLIFDDKGNPMSPTHTRKKNRRYRYYVSQAALQYKEQETGSVVRLAANVIESLIIVSLHKLLTSPLRLLQILESHHSTHEIDRFINHAAGLAADWDKKLPSEHIAMLKLVLRSITVGKKSVKIVYSRAGITGIIQPGFDHSSFNKPDAEGDEYEEVKPVYLKRAGIESRLIVEEGTTKTAPAHPETVQALQSAVSKAFAWNDALVNGRVASMTELAREEDVVPQFIIRRIKFAYLAPDIVEAIFEGKVPHTLSLGALENSLPLAWSEQRRLFGVAG